MPHLHPPIPSFSKAQCQKMLVTTQAYAKGRCVKLCQKLSENKGEPNKKAADPKIGG